MFGSKKRKVDEVVEEAYWNGFFACLGGYESGNEGLEYASTSGYYDMNEIRRMAYAEGSKYCLEVLERRANDKASDRRPLRSLNSVSRDIPGRVYAEAYGLARIAYKREPRQRLTLRRENHEQSCE